MNFKKIGKFVVVLMFLLVILAGCNLNFQPGGEFEEEEYIVTQEDMDTLVAQNNEFALSFYEQFEEESDVFYSPYSLYTALTMLYNAAEADTATKMNEELGIELGDRALNKANLEFITELLSLNAEESYKFNTGNAFWGNEDYNYNQAYLDLLEEYYLADTDLIDMGNPEVIDEIINGWISEQTNDRIENMIDPDNISAATVMILANAIYFHAEWENQFCEDRTKDIDFTAIDSEEREVPMMWQEKRLPYYSADNFSALKLPYKDNNMYMLVLIPDEYDGLDEFENDLNVDKIEEIKENLEEELLDLSFPKFENEFDYNLNEDIQEYGLDFIYNQDESNFSNMYSNDDEESCPAWVGNILQDTFISVDESGTEAAGATVIEVPVDEGGVERTSVTVNRPFTYLIMDGQTDSILFMGRFTGLDI